MCNDACLEAAKIAHGSYTVRDVWAQADLFDGKAIKVDGETQLVSSDLAAVAGTAYLKLTPSTSGA